MVYKVQVTPTPVPGRYPYTVTRVTETSKRKTRTYTHFSVGEVRERVRKAIAKGHHVRVVEVKYVQLLDTEFGPKRM